MYSRRDVIHRMKCPLEALDLHVQQAGCNTSHEICMRNIFNAKIIVCGDSRGPGHTPYDCSYVQDTFILEKLCSRVTPGVHDAPDLDPGVGRVFGLVYGHKGSGTCSI